MLPALSSYLIREHVGMFKLTDTYDIFDGASGQQLAVAKEKKGLLNSLAGLLVNKRNLPTRVDVHEGMDINGPIAFSITRGFSFLRPTVKVLAGDGSLIGSFKSRLLTLGGKFGETNSTGKLVAADKGVVSSRGAVTANFATEFIQAIAQHRHWERENSSQ